MWKQVEGKPYKTDGVGNILQEGGGVTPKACSKCRSPFESRIEDVPVKQSVPIYKCTKCGFQNASADASWDHEKSNPGHEIFKTKSERIVTVERKIVGKVAKIVVASDGSPSVVCESCLIV